MPTAKARLLVVDDDRDALTTYRVMLSLAGYEVSTAQTGREGVDLLQSEDLRLILTDLRMPDLSGLELLAEARVRVPHIPVIVYTAWGSSASEFAARHLGAVDFFDKSWDQEAFVELVARHVSKPGVSGISADDLAVHVGPATRRWVSVVVAITHSRRDIPTLTDWAEELGKSVATLKRWCAMCDVHASDSVGFSRALRVVLTMWARIILTAAICTLGPAQRSEANAAYYSDTWMSSCFVSDDYCPMYGTGVLEADYGEYYDVSTQSYLYGPNDQWIRLL